jgi:hypothetical protein
MRILKSLDLLVLGIALPVFIAAGLPLLGWAATTFAWVASRVFQSFAEKRAVASGKRQVALGARAAVLLGRLYLVGLTVLVAGVIEREAGLTAGILAVVVFTIYFATLFVVKPMEEADR